MDKTIQTQNTREIHGNFLVPPVYRFLKMNDARIAYPQFETRPFVTEARNDTAAMDVIEQAFADHDWGVSQEILDLNKAQRNFVHTVACSRDMGYAKLELDLSEANPVLVDTIDIYAQKNCNTTLVLEYGSKDETPGFRNSQLRILAQADAHVRVVLLQLHNEQTTCVQSVGIVADDTATVEVLQVELGSAHAYNNVVADLKGEQSTSLIDVIYFLEKQQELDLVYKLNHIAPKTTSQLMINGVQKGESVKTFRGTIDFRQGSSGSKGAEKESVTLLNDGVVSRSVPLLLCGDEDVEGSHAVSAGQVDPDMLFYLMTRGLSEKQAMRMITEARLTPLLDKIPDEPLRDYCLDLVRDRIYGDLAVKRKEFCHNQLVRG